MTVLLTGFEPFDGDTVNPSWEAVGLVPGVRAVQVPCVFGAAVERLREAVAEHDPRVVVCVGQAGGRADVTVERVAVNLDDARIPDNAGRQPIDEPVVRGGPAAYFATLPVKACVAAARAVGVPASVSQSAGTFVCNHLFYGLMHLIATERPDIRGGFVHVPFAPGQVADRAAPSMPPALVAEALTAIVTAASSMDGDLRLVGGSLH
ncbi:pyroglutamyl-peptidase I [Streptosporangium sandarakinum]|uniref:Pyrrolidone-carboxylate peptidase n=1 Tax=Streptosporangium sandarakinum TaxID=1260955 RepID=A0A852V6R8_9ACTN|nr:pyroglutamyl-peptidase I [Streptosporangium sandarakinum]NYF43846.1 pyroglutamyl-peptidase [Streptosporangium sandarakinum]